MIEKTLVILIAPNVSEQMGGEAIKALQIFRELKKFRPNTIQITHQRNEAELSARLKLPDVHYVPDTKLSVFLWKSRILRALLDPWFCRNAIRLADKLAPSLGYAGNAVIIHQTEPNSPVMPRFISINHRNVFGPINGNIYYPPIFRKYESLSATLRRIFHRPFQVINRIFFRDITRADAVLCAGGTRTRTSLSSAGCPDQIMVDSVDCGVSDNLLDRDRISHSGQNLKFVHFGRLVFHKGTTLIIESLAKTKLPIHLDVIGRGPELERCKSLVSALALDGRVKFIDWFPSHGDLLDHLSQYRGSLLPSLEDANGIVVQESMALGLPTICLNWGGPKSLIRDRISGFLIDPVSKNHILSEMAEILDRLANDGGFAEKISIAARSQADQWRWSKIIPTWIDLYAGRSPLLQQ
jgi:glycosyltransferase involved in cell wall biosynthesis